MCSDPPSSARGDKLLMGLAIALLVLVAALEVGALLSIHHRLGALGQELEATQVELTRLSESIQAARAEIVKMDEQAVATDDADLRDDPIALTELLSDARALPHRGDDGRVDGLRLIGVRGGSLLAELGVENGDVIHAVNGYPLTSTESAMQAYEDLSDATSFRLQLSRRGTPVELEIDVR